MAKEKAEAEAAKSKYPLHEAARNGDAEAVRTLLSTPSVDRDAEDENGVTPLIEACMAGDLEMVQLLLDAGCPAQPAPGFRHAPLRGATVCGHAHLIPALLGAGADPNARSDGERTPLMGACFLRKGVDESKSAECVRALLEDETVDPTLRNSFGESALDLARVRGYHESVALVEKAVKEWKEKSSKSDE